MVQKLCTSGNNEVLKCGVHGAAGVIAGVMAAYNIAACCFRRDHHLKLNAVVYTLAVGFEIRQTLPHLRAVQACKQVSPAGASPLHAVPAAKCA